MTERHDEFAADNAVNTAAKPKILSAKKCFEGAIFSVEERQISLPGLAKNSSSSEETAENIVIRRQIVSHSPCVVMLVHDCKDDKYFIEREYRAGPNDFVYGLVAGLIDENESIETAMFRELAEETGIEPDLTEDGCADVQIDYVGDFYSSEGFTDELAHIAVIHLRSWHKIERKLDKDEHVDVFKVDWQTLRKTKIMSSNNFIAIQAEEIRRLKEKI